MWPRSMHVHCLLLSEEGAIVNEGQVAALLRE